MSKHKAVELSGRASVSNQKFVVSHALAALEAWFEVGKIHV